jgi:hypothetical protein
MPLTFQVVATLRRRGSLSITSAYTPHHLARSSARGSKTHLEIVDSSISRRHRAPEKKREPERERERTRVIHPGITSHPSHLSLSSPHSSQSPSHPSSPPPSFDVSRVRDSINRSIYRSVGRPGSWSTLETNLGPRINTSIRRSKPVHQKAKAASLQQQEAERHSHSAIADLYRICRPRVPLSNHRTRKKGT